MKITFLTTSLMMFFANYTYAQFYHEVNVGPKLGLNYSSLTNIYQTIYREGYENFDWEEKSEIGAHFGVFLNYKTSQEKIGIQPEIYYSMEHSTNNYSDVNGLEYELKFKYNFLQINTLVKYYPTGGLNVGVGPQLGINLQKEAIYYSSNGESADNGSDELVQSLLRKGLYGKNNFEAVFSLGYEFEMGLALEARYNLGLADIIETQNNEHGWTEKDNKLNTFQFTLYYGFGIDN